MEVGLNLCVIQPNKVSSISSQWSGANPIVEIYS